MNRPSALLLDVNETLSDLQPLQDRFTEVGLPPGLAATWFAGVLRDGFALAVGGVSADFATIAAEVLRGLLAGRSGTPDPEEAVARVLEGFGSLDVHPDVRAGLPRLAGSGVRLATLTNGSTSVAEGLLDRAGLGGTVEELMSVEEAGLWKPARAAYAHGCRRLGLEPDAVMLVAVHPWDLDGASRAGLGTCWVDRTGAGYPSYFRKPDLTVSGFDELAERLAS